MTWHRSAPHKSLQIIPARHTGMGPHPTYMKYYCQPIKIIRLVSSSPPLQLSMTPLCFMSFWINLIPSQDSPKNVLGIALCQRIITSHNRWYNVCICLFVCACICLYSNTKMYNEINKSDFFLLFCSNLTSAENLNTLYQRKKRVRY